MLCLIPDDEVKDERLNLNLPSEVKQAGCLTVCLLYIKLFEKMLTSLTWTWPAYFIEITL